MTALAYLIPIALALGLLGLGAFMWALRSGQFEDPEGAGQRILFDDEDEPGREDTERSLTEARITHNLRIPERL